MKEHMHICEILWEMSIMNIKIKEKDSAFYLNFKSLKEDWNECYLYAFNIDKSVNSAKIS